MAHAPQAGYNDAMAYNTYLPPASQAQIDAVHAMVHVTPSMVRYDNAQIAASLCFPFIELAVLVVISQSGLAGRFGIALLNRVGQRLFIAGILFWIALHVVTTVVAFPLHYYSGFVLPHRFGLSTEHLDSWLADYAKGWAIDTVIGALIASSVLLLIRRAPSRWPFVAAALLIPVVAAGIFAEPLIVDPLFNKFTPMAHSDPLYPRIESLARKAGIGDAVVFVVDKSKQTNETNAYVTGIGSTKRIVIWDTLIKRMTPKQVTAVVGHEMGHYAEHHIVFGFIATVAALFLVLPLTRAFAMGLFTRWGKRWRIDSLHEPGALAVILLVFNVIMLVAMPIASTASRYIEHRADAFGIAVTGDRITFATALIALSSQNLSNPYPPRWVALLMDHPPLGERIDFALTGQPRDLRPQPGLPSAAH